MDINENEILHKEIVKQLFVTISDNLPTGRQAGLWLSSNQITKCKLAKEGNYEI